MEEVAKTILCDTNNEAYIDLFIDGVVLASFKKKEKSFYVSENKEAAIAMAKEWIDEMIESEEYNNATFDRRFDCNEKI